MKHSIKERAKYVPLETKLKVLNEMVIQSMLIDMKVIPDGFWSDEQEEKYGGFRKFAEKLTKAQMKTIAEIEAEKGKELPETQYEKSLRLLDRFLKETPKEELNKIIAEYDNMKYEGPTLDEYFKAIGYIPDQSLPKEPTPELRDELIICSAIWIDDNHKYEHQPSNIESGYVVCGMRHHHCFLTISLIKGEDFRNADYGKVTQGFLTNKDRFVNREEAYTIAFKANQIIGPNKGYAENSIGLTSEDLY